VQARGLVTGLAVRAGAVRGDERADDELARLDRLDTGADLLDHAAVLVPDRVRRLHLGDPAVEPQIRAAHAGGGEPDDRVLRLFDPRLVALLEAYVPWAVKDRSAHDGSPYR
jgi:hypothetical protein